MQDSLAGWSAVVNTRAGMASTASFGCLVLAMLVPGAGLAKVFAETYCWKRFQRNGLPATG